MSESTKIAMQLLSGKGNSTNTRNIPRQITDKAKTAESSRQDLANLAAMCMTRLDDKDNTP